MTVVKIVQSVIFLLRNKVCCRMHRLENDRKCLDINCIFLLIACLSMIFHTNRQFYPRTSVKGSESSYQIYE